MPPYLLIATGNPGKFREIVAVLQDLPFEFISLSEFPGAAELTEDRDTFMGNAVKKALHYAEISQMRTLADDSGLEVDVLDGRPGVHSARFAGRHRDDAANNRKLIALLEDVPIPRRTARFRCAIAIANPGMIELTAEGHIDGLIIDEPRGTNGFGYDPHFLIPALGQTTAELSPAHKNAISHRGRALRAIRTKLAELPN